MRVTEFFRLLIKPVVVIAIIFIIIPFVAYFYGENEDIISIALKKLDLRNEGTFAAWYESILFILCGITFALIGWSKKAEDFLSRFIQLFFRLMSLACIFMSADEAIELHESMGRKIEHKTGIFDQTSLQEIGFSWILVYGPIALIGIVIIASIYKNVLIRLPLDNNQVRSVKKYLMCALAGIPFVISLEIFEGYLWYADQKNVLLPCFEEMLEVFVISCFIWCNYLIAKFSDL